MERSFLSARSCCRSGSSRPLLRHRGDLSAWNIFFAVNQLYLFTSGFSALSPADNYLDNFDGENSTFLFPNFPPVKLFVLIHRKKFSISVFKKIKF